MPYKVKTATMDVKTASMNDKTATVFDKTASMFGTLWKETEIRRDHGDGTHDS